MTDMLPATGLSAGTIVLRALFLSAVALLGACGGDDKPASQQQQGGVAEAPLPVREWYPRAKHMQPTRPGQFQAAMPPPTYGRQGAAMQQPWGMPPPPVISWQAPQNAQPQQPWGWPNQRPIMPQTQPQPVMPVYQYAPRPWGDMTAAPDERRTNIYSETWPPNSYSLPGGARTSSGYPGWGTGQNGAVPYNGYYGNAW